MTSRSLISAFAPAAASTLQCSSPSSLPFASFSGLSRHDFSSVASAQSSASQLPSLSSFAAFPSTSLPSKRRSLRVQAMTDGESSLPVLNELPLVTYIGNQGRIFPPVESTTKATVFAVFDQNKKIQYIGFSKDVRNSLRTLLGRRPELCYFYKLYNLDDMDQQKMLSIRQQWFSEVGIPPVGNTDSVQREKWEKPVDAGSISERGRAAAALSQAKTLQQMMRDRGLKEKMEYDPALLEQGKCDVLPSEGLSNSDIAAQAELDAESAALSQQLEIKAPDGEVIEFNMTIVKKIKTNGGWMFDITINKDNKDTRHRVVCGRIYTDAAKMAEEDFVTRVFAFLLWKKVPRQTEGLLAIDQFPSNYFAVSEVAQKFEDFKDWFTTELPESYWRFNKIHSYGDDESPILPREIPQLFFPSY